VATRTPGLILSATFYSSTAAFGRRLSQSGLSTEKPETVVNLTTIQTAHTAAFTVMLVGRLASLAVLTTIQYPEPEAGDPPKPYRRTVPDHVLCRAASPAAEHSRPRSPAVALPVTPHSAWTSSENPVRSPQRRRTPGIPVGPVAPQLER